MVAIFFGLAALGAALAAPLAAIGAGIGEGLVFASAIQSMARQPEMEGKIRSTMLLCFGIIEALFILSFVLFFIMQKYLPTPDQITAMLNK